MPVSFKTDLSLKQESQPVATYHHIWADANKSKMRGKTTFPTARAQGAGSAHRGLPWSCFGPECGFGWGWPLVQGVWTLTSRKVVDTRGNSAGGGSVAVLK